MLRYSTDLQAVRDKFAHVEPRPGQLEAIAAILDAFESGKRYVFLEGPTGAGKSVIGITVSEFFSTCYYLTIQRFLQTQLAREFSQSTRISSPLVELKGRSNYPCTYWQNFGQELLKRGAVTEPGLQKHLDRDYRCDDGYCYRSLGKSKCASCFPPATVPDWEKQQWLAQYGVRFSACPYYEQVFKTMEAPKALLNFSSFLYQTTFAGHRFPARELMILDESHHAEEQLLKFVSFSITDFDMAEQGIELPNLEDAASYAPWVIESGMLDHIKDLIELARQNQDARRQQELEITYWRLDRFLQCVQNGIVNWVHDWKEHKPSNTSPFRTVTIRPVFIRAFAKDLLLDYGEKVLLMSATILDHKVMAKALGIKLDETAFLRMPMSFPKKNRPIYLLPGVIAKGGRNEQGNWGPKMVKWVDGILRKYPEHRGIIHTHNFSIAKMFLSDCAGRKRFLFQEDFRDKEQMLEKHSSIQDSVIVAPAMHEGLDLKDELARFQIIAKCPWPDFFSDKQLAARIENDRRYLIWLVAIKLVQSVGRAVRHDQDWAHTYVVDANVDKFLKEAKSLLPEWFKEALIHVR